MRTWAVSMGAIPRDLADLGRLCHAAHHHGLDHLWKTFHSKLPDLFVDDTAQCKVGVATADRDVHWVSSPDDLRTFLEGGDSTLIVLGRYTSWSRLDITIHAFSVVCHLATVTPFFLHFIVGMGRKFSSKDEDFMSCYSTFSLENNSLFPNPESNTETQGDPFWAICYNVRHFELHSRDLEDPWSCRQSALHHSYSVTSKKSTWVVIQPPEAFDLNVDSSPYPMSLHIRYLHAALANWREYFDFIAQKIKPLNQQIEIPNTYQKFRISFSHEQYLHRLRRRLHHARSILISTRNTLNAIAEHERAVMRKQKLCSSDHFAFQRDMHNLSLEVDNYIETSDKLLRISDDLKLMYNNVLNFRGQELQHDTSLKLAQLAQADAAGKRDMATLADLTYKDSQSMRIATAIAMFYLPVNLVMSFFSSTFVSYESTDDGQTSHGSRMRVHSEIWIAIVAAVVLAISTVCWSWWWNRKADRRLNKKYS